jgi:two-component system, NarL family, nitrate/nitrite response regulator NarL
VGAALSSSDRRTKGGPAILIVDDHRMLADALASVLTAKGYHCEVAELDGIDSVPSQAVVLRPELTLLDLDLGCANGLELIGPIRATGSRVLVVTACEDQQRLAAAVALGAVGWVNKARRFEVVIEAAETAVRDRPLLPSLRHQDLANVGKGYLDVDLELRTRIDRLTTREKEVLAGIARGANAQDMAEEFVVSIGTVRTHIRSVLTKLGVSSQVAAAALAVQWSASRRGLDRNELLSPLKTGA